MPTSFAFKVQVDGVEPGGKIVAVVGAGKVVEKAVLEEGVAEEEEGKEGEEKEGRGAYSCEENAVLIDQRYETTPRQTVSFILLIFFCRQSRGQGCQKGNGEDNGVQF
eukprot:evm.model.NODE_21577_length_8844_cov_12.987676.1